MKKFYNKVMEMPIQIGWIFWLMLGAALHAIFY